jgi:hypothetical protein
MIRKDITTFHITEESPEGLWTQKMLLYLKMVQYEPTLHEIC